LLFITPPYPSSLLFTLYCFFSCVLIFSSLVLALPRFPPLVLILLRSFSLFFDLTRSSFFILALLRCLFFITVLCSSLYLPCCSFLAVLSNPSSPSSSSYLIPFLFQVLKGLKSNTSFPPSTIEQIENLTRFERQAIIRRQILRLLDGGTLPLKPEMSAVERGIKETELLSFSAFSTADMHRSNQLQYMQDMLQEHSKPMPNFTGAMTAGRGDSGSVLKRKYFRRMSSLTFSQLLSQEIEKEPIVVKKYYPLTDNLLYSLHWPPPDRRMKATTWCPNGSFLTALRKEIKVNDTKSR
jgi:hypothetical protein